jgi:hypothetical protein
MNDKLKEYYYIVITIAMVYYTNYNTGYSYHPSWYSNYNPLLLVILLFI